MFAKQNHAKELEIPENLEPSVAQHIEHLTTLKEQQTEEIVKLEAINQKQEKEIAKLKEQKINLKSLQEDRDTLINSIDGIVWEADAQTFEFTFVSQQAERILGYSATSWLNEPTFWIDHVHPDDQNWAAEFCINQTKKCKDHEFEYRMMTQNGRTVWLHDLVTVILENQHPVKLRGIMVDITSQKKMAQDLERQRIKVLQADRLKALGEMAAGIAHELNQPLTAISVLSEGILLREEAGIPVPKTHMNQCMKDLLRLVERMSEIINHMKEFSRDTSKTEKVRFQISEVIRNALKFYKTQLAVHDIAVQVHIAENEPQCNGWPNEVEQVLLNLISNAQDAILEQRQETHKHMSKNTSEWKPELHILSEYEQQENCVKINISDTGGGIPNDILEKVFDPFFTAKEVGQGTGLGLSIAQGIIKNHGGSIEVDNRLGEGITFSVILPCIEKESHA